MATNGTDAWGGLEVHPGYTLRQEIEARGLTQRGLATRMGRPEQVISDIVNGRKSITPSTATELERVLDIPAYFWVDLVRQHDLAIGRIAERKSPANADCTPKRLPRKRTHEARMDTACQRRGDAGQGTVQVPRRGIPRGTRRNSSCILPHHWR